MTDKLSHLKKNISFGFSIAGRYFHDDLLTSFWITSCVYVYFNYQILY